MYAAYMYGCMHVGIYVRVYAYSFVEREYRHHPYSCGLWLSTVLLHVSVQLLVSWELFVDLFSAFSLRRASRWECKICRT